MKHRVKPVVGNKARAGWKGKKRDGGVVKGWKSVLMIWSYVHTGAQM